MNIDWQAIFDAALDAGAATAKSKAPQIRDALRQTQAGHEAAIKDIGTAFMLGEIDEDVFKSSLEDEATTLRLELLAVSVMSKAIAQRAVNAFRDALIDGIKSAVSAVI